MIDFGADIDHDRDEENYHRYLSTLTRKAKEGRGIKHRVPVNRPCPAPKQEDLDPDYR